MSAQLPLYSGHYRASWGLVIGINDYDHFPPLSCAVKDASDIAACLSSQYGFQRDKIVVLLDGLATLDNILNVFDTTLNRRNVAPDDRIIIFFAGHGVTREASDGAKVGYIAPADAQPRAWRTLLRMNDLIDQASFLPAKHILFIIDACYSGLSLLRGTPSDQVVESFMAHRAVQIITAGKEAEMVADGGDREDDNSVFTSYLLQALAGHAVTATGLMTASDVMHYVYRQVIRTPGARQTPQYGWLEGDGDLVFYQPSMDSLAQDIELALRQGSVPARIAAVSQLVRIASTQDSEGSRLALDRLEEVARNDPDPRVRYTALRVLGVDISPPTPVAAPTQRMKIRVPQSRRALPPLRKLNWITLPVVMMTLCAVGSLIGGIFALSGPLASTYASGGFQDTPVGDIFPGETSTGEAPGMASPAPIATATLTQSNTLALPIIPADSAVIFQDDFSAMNDVWGPAPNNSLAVRYIGENGQMFFGLYKPYELWVSQPNNVIAQDFVYSVTIAPRQTQSDAAYGLVFRQYDFDNYYFYRIGMDGTFSLILQDGGAVRQLVPPTSIDALAHSGQSHRLTVDARGPTIILSVDDAAIATVNSPTLSYLRGTVGVAIEARANTPVSITFDDFVLYQP